MFNSVLNMSADDVIGKNAMICGANDERDIVVTHMLEWLLQERQVYWTLGGNGQAVKIGSPSFCIPFDFLPYENSVDNPTIYYFNRHSIEDILMGRNPDMVPDKVQIVEGNDIMLHFSLSEELRTLGVDSSFRLDDNAVISVDVSGSEKGYLLRYVIRKGRLMPRMETIYHDNGARSYATFNTAV